jgi:hypothetical protein
MTRNRFGFSATVRAAAVSLRTEGGTEGNGSANSVEAAEGEEEIESFDHIKPRVHFGRSQRSKALLPGGFVPLLVSTVFDGMPPIADEALVPVLAQFTCASSCIKSLADRLLP